ncbi:MAG: TIGR02466 family protein [Planctomycetota bacterium]
MLADLGPSIAAAAGQRRLRFAWTGDVNGSDDLHRRAAFAWLRGEVEREARAFLAALGCELPRLQLYFQSSWAVLSTAAEVVAEHSHPQANLSAVYYLQIPAGDGGELVFENVSQPNALGPDLDRPDLVRPNALNARQACYQPREGRLLLFSSRQPHHVRAHGADELRVSITFDLAVAPRETADDPHERGRRQGWDAFHEEAAPA